MKIEVHKDNCCGCTSCASACPKQAITMQPDTLGFLYPQINEDICIDCGRCVQVCSFKSDYETPYLQEIKAYGGRHKSLQEVAKSQSGAAFVVLSDYVLSKGGVVYGVGYEDNFRVVHKRATTKDARDEFRGSKYVQSDLSGILPQIKQDLKDGLLVMFSGTPCQVASVASFVGNGRLRDNLLLMDIVCHGVPGPYVWRDYLKFLENKEKKKITKVNFRDKGIKGWRSHIESFTFDYTYTYTYTYTYLFYSHINLRYSCAKCPFTNLRRVSDITVSDFWGVENTIASELGKDNKGCSLFLVNTKKGAAWFDEVKDEIEYIPVETKDCIQPQLIHPSVLNKKRAQFEKDYQKYGFAYTRRKYGDVGWHYYTIKLKKLIKKRLPFLEQIIKRIKNS